jgi:hypothetical protein
MQKANGRSTSAISSKGASMEVAEFIEQDILIFLDEQLDAEKEPQQTTPGISTVYLTRDYEKELNDAMQRNQPTAAKDVLHALKDQFDVAPDGTQDKERLKTLLMTLYERYKDYLDKQHIPVQPTTAEPDAPPPPLTEAKAEAPTTREAPPIVESLMLTAALHRIDEALAKQDVRTAVAAYRDAKHEALLVAQPMESLVKVSTAFGRIKQAIQNKAVEAPRRNIADRSPITKPDLDKQLLMQLEREKRMLDAMLHANDFKAAKQQHNRMRAIALQIADHATARTATAKLDRISTIIGTLQRQNDERRLQARP